MKNTATKRERRSPAVHQLSAGSGLSLFDSRIQSESRERQNGLDLVSCAAPHCLILQTFQIRPKSSLVCRTPAASTQTRRSSAWFQSEIKICLSALRFPAAHQVAARSKPLPIKAAFASAGSASYFDSLKAKLQAQAFACRKAEQRSCDNILYHISSKNKRKRQKCINYEQIHAFVFL